MVFRQTLTVFSGKVSQARSEWGLADDRGFLATDQLFIRKRLDAEEGFELSTFGL